MVPEGQLLGPACRLQDAAAECQEASSTADLNAKSPEVGESANGRRSALAHEALCRGDTDPGYAHQHIVRRCRDVHGELLRVCECPCDFGVVGERQAPV